MLDKSVIYICMVYMVNVIRTSCLSERFQFPLGQRGSDNQSWTVLSLILFQNNIISCTLNSNTSILPRAYRPQRGKGHATIIQDSVPSKIQIRQWFVTVIAAVWTALASAIDFTTFSLWIRILPGTS